MTSQKLTFSILFSLIILFIPASADAQSPSVFLIDQFTVMRNGSLFFQDNFDDGAPPPSAPNFVGGGPASYSVLGTLNESGSKVRLDTEGAEIVSGIGVPRVPFFHERALLLTSTNPDSSSGLKQSATFSVTGVFDLAVPGTNREGYGIRLTDRTGTNLGDDTLVLEIQRGQTGVVRIRFRRFDFMAQTVTNIDSALLESEHDQIALTLTRASTENNGISASFAYIDGGVMRPVTTFDVTANIFNGENFTRAQFFLDTPDSDADRVPDSLDNCASTYNPDQGDKDFDGVGDACDNCPINANADQLDDDGDLQGNVCDNKTSNAALAGGNTVSPGAIVTVTFEFTFNGPDSIITPTCGNITQVLMDSESQLISVQEKYEPVEVPKMIQQVSAGQKVALTCEVTPSETLNPDTYSFFGVYTGGGYVDPDIVNGVCTVQTCFDNIFTGPLKSNTVEFTVTDSPPVTPVQMDIKPDAFPNVVNPKSKGVLPVAIFSTASFDARQIDVASLRLAGAPVQAKGKGFNAAFADVNGDGLPDLVAHFVTQQLQLNLLLGQVDTIAVLKGSLNDETAFTATDSVKVVP